MIKGPAAWACAIQTKHRIHARRLVRPRLAGGAEEGLLFLCWRRMAESPSYSRFYILTAVSHIADGILGLTRESSRPNKRSRILDLPTPSENDLRQFLPSNAFWCSIGACEQLPGNKIHGRIVRSNSPRTTFAVYRF